MATTRRRLRLGAVLALSFACDTGNSIRATVTIPSDVAAAYSEANPGLLLVLFQTEGWEPVLHEVAVVCGEARSFQVSNHTDGELNASTITAWIEPASGRSCGQVGKVIELDGIYVDSDEPQAREMFEPQGGCDGNQAQVALDLAGP